MIGELTLAGGLFLILLNAMPYAAMFKKVDDGVSLTIFAAAASGLACGIVLTLLGLEALL